MSSRFLRIVMYVGLAVVGLVVVVVAAFVIDDRLAHEETVARNVTLGGEPIGGLGSADLRRVLSDLADQTAQQELTVMAPDRTLTTSNAEAGVRLDTVAVAQAAFDAGRTGGFVADFTSWLGSFTGARTVADAYVLDEEPLRSWVRHHPERVLSRPVEPSFTGESGTLVVTPSEPGARIAVPPVLAAVAEEVEAGRVPVTVEVGWSPVPPQVDDATLSAAVAVAEDIATRPLAVQMEEEVVQLGETAITRWIASERDGAEIQAVLDEERIQADLEQILEDIETEGESPSYEVVDGELEVEFGTPPMRCCAEGAGEIVAEALFAGSEAAGSDEPVELPLVAVEDPEEQVARLGITELVGEFTTNHACCENRVQNIQRIADIVRGVIIPPGERFSINEYVGVRTTEKGFVPAGTIQHGRFVDGVGGGISQFATTMFNAAFFAGLDFIAYQSHSIYISRYPRGREATLSYPVPDLIVENNTPFGMLVWPTYTGTSITVQLWSTPYFEVEQTGQSSFNVSECTRVETYRQRTAPDGEVLEDMVFATYRPGEGLDCNGNPTPEDT